MNGRESVLSLSLGDRVFSSLPSKLFEFFFLSQSWVCYLITWESLTGRFHFCSAGNKVKFCGFHPWRSAVMIMRRTSCYVLGPRQNEKKNHLSQEMF